MSFQLNGRLRLMISIEASHCEILCSHFGRGLAWGWFSQLNSLCCGLPSHGKRLSGAVKRRGLIYRSGFALSWITSPNRVFARIFMDWEHFERFTRDSLRAHLAFDHCRSQQDASFSSASCLRFGGLGRCQWSLQACILPVFRLHFDRQGPYPGKQDSGYITVPGTKHPYFFFGTYSVRFPWW